jgi:hypothetical protein
VKGRNACEMALSKARVFPATNDAQEVRARPERDLASPRRVETDGRGGAGWTRVIAELGMIIPFDNQLPAVSFEASTPAAALRI